MLINHQRPKSPVLDQCDGDCEKVSVIVPVFNEATLIRQSLQNVIVAFAERNVGVELIVVDDCSSDGTTAVLRECVADRDVDDGRCPPGLALTKPFVLIEHEVNRGKGASIRTGLERVSAPVVVIHDADLEYDPQDLPKMLDRMNGNGSVDVVYGSRCLPDSQNPRRHNAFAWGVTLLNFAVRLLYGVRVTDEATCYKMFRTEDLRRMDLQCERFEFCPEVTAKAARMGLRIVEVPITYRPRDVTEGKKIRLSDGIEAMKALWRYRRWQPKHVSNSRTTTNCCLASKPCSLKATRSV